MQVTPTEPAETVWSRHAKRWNLVGSPLRPCAEDSRQMAAWAEASLATAQDPTTLVLGVTPEIVSLPCLADHGLVAVDHSASMVGALWQADRAPVVAGRHVCCIADWRQVPLASHSVALALGDGSLNALPSPAEARVALREWHRVLQPGAALALRCFVRSEAGTIAQIVAEAQAGRIGSFDAFKWRLAMALASPEDGSVGVAEVLRCFESEVRDRQVLALRSGWSLERMSSIDHYRDSPSRYHFPTAEALRALVAPWFEIVEWRAPSYELGACCPSLLLRSQAPALDPS